MTVLLRNNNIYGIYPNRNKMRLGSSNLYKNHLRISENGGIIEDYTHTEVF